MFTSLPAIVIPGEDTQETSNRATRISITWIVQGALHAFASRKHPRNTQGNILLFTFIRGRTGYCVLK